MEKKFTISLDLKRKTFSTLSGVKTGDNLSIIYIKLLQDSVTFNLTGLTVRANLKRPDGQTFFQDASTGIEVTNAAIGEFKIKLLSSALEKVGVVNADISIFNATNEKITSANFNFEVIESIYSEAALEGRDDYDLLKNLSDTEASRVAAETIRKTNEDTRKSNETIRSSSEALRITNEDTRKSNENTRSTNESARASAELNRQGNENIRVTNESTRVTEFNTIKADYNTYKSVMIAGSNVAALQEQINTNSAQLAENQTQSISTNLNSVISLPNSKSGVGEVQKIEGRTIVNLLGDAGDCDDLSKWTGNIGTTVDNGTKLFGSNSFKNISAGNIVYKDVLCDQTHKYLASAYCYITSITSGEPCLKCYDYGITANSTLVSFDATKLNQWQRKSVIVTGKANGGIRFSLGWLNGGSGVAYYDGAMIYDLTALGLDGITDVAELERKLPFANGVASLNPKLTVTNLVTNGDFRDGTTGWNTLNGTTVTALNGTLTSVGTGTVLAPYVGNNTGYNWSSGKKIYACCLARVTNSSCSKINIEAASQIGSVTNPVQNQWYKVSGIQTQTTENGNIAIFARQFYADSATANGKVMEVQQVFVVDLTAMFGAGYEPSIEWCDKYLSFVNGTTTIGALSIKSVGKNSANLDTPSVIGNNVVVSKITNGIKIKNSIASTFSNAIYKVKLKPNTQYIFTRTMSRVTGVNSRTAIYDSALVVPIGSPNANIGTSSSTFTTDNTGIISLVFYASVSTSELAEADFTNIQLEEGTVATAYEVNTENSITLPGECADMKSIGTTVKDYTDLYAKKKVKNVSDWRNLTGDDGWATSGIYAGSKLFNFALTTGGLAYLGIKYNGIQLSNYTAGGNSIVDHIEINSSNVFINASNTDTGFGDGYSPSNPEVKSYFYGWKLCHSDGVSPYVPSLGPYTPSTWAEWTKDTGVVGDSTGVTFTANGTSAVQIRQNSNFKTSTKYGFLYNVVSTTLTTTQFYITSSSTAFNSNLGTTNIGNNKAVLTSLSTITANTVNFFVYNGVVGESIKIKDIRIFELPTGSQIETDFNTLTADQLAAKYLFYGLNPKNWKRVIEKPLTDDFSKKIAGSDVENANKFKFAIATSLQTPSSFVNEYTQPSYDSIKTLNGSLKEMMRSGNGEIPQQLFSFNLIRLVEEKYGVIPGADTATKVAYIKNNGVIDKINFYWYGYGSCPSGNKARIRCFDTSNNVWAWGDSGTYYTTSSTVVNLSGARTTTMTNAIDDNGFTHFLASTDASDGITPSTIYTDYVFVDVQVKPTATLPTTMPIGYTPYKMCYQLATPIETDLSSKLDNVLEIYPNSTLIVDSNIPCNVEIKFPTNLAAAVKMIGRAVDQMTNSLGNVWKSLLSLADRELRMKSVQLLSTETTADLKAKINEILNIWR